MGGQDKGLVQFAGRPLIEYCLQVVSDESERVIISCNRNSKRYRKYSEFVVTDPDHSYSGPLAGLIAAKPLCEQEWVFCCPCDTPFLPTEIITLLKKGVDEQLHDIAVCHDGQRRQNLLMLAKVSCLDSIAHYLEQGNRRVDAWQDQWRIAEVDCSEYADRLLNVNDQSELRP